MDQFAEQLVKKNNSTKDDMKRALIIIATVTLSVIALLLAFMGFPLALILPVAAIYAAFYLMKMLNVEYEYSCTNGTLDIDKILGRTKRVPMLTVEVSAFTNYGKTGTCEESDKEMTTFSAVGLSLMGNDDEADDYYAEFCHPEHGMCCLYFTPDVHFREALEPFLSREMKRTLKKNS
jgi:hypothetical protein